MDEVTIECYIRSYHVYKEVWTALTGEEVICSRESENATDRYTVAVIKKKANNGIYINSQMQSYK